MLIRDGRLRPLTDPRALELEKRVPDESERVRRDPRIMLDLLLSAADEFHITILGPPPGRPPS